MAECLTAAEFAQWADDDTLLSCVYYESVFAPAILRGMAFGLPDDSFAMTALANRLAQFTETHEVGLFVSEFGVFRHSEHIETYERIRRSEGLGFSLQEREADVVGQGEAGYLRCLLTAGLFSHWRLIVITKPLALSLHVTDDLIFLITGGESGEIRMFRDWCKEIEFPKPTMRYLRQLYPLPLAAYEAKYGKKR